MLRLLGRRSSQMRFLVKIHKRLNIMEKKLVEKKLVGALRARYEAQKAEAEATAKAKTKSRP